MDESTVETAVLAYFDAVGSADADTFVALFSEDVRFEDPVGGPVMEGRSGVRGFHKSVERAWAELKMDAEEIFVRGDRAAVLWTAEGHSQTGADIEFEGINIFRVNDDGEITAMEGFWDFEDVIGQM